MFVHPKHHLLDHMPGTAAGTTGIKMHEFFHGLGIVDELGPIGM
jgi:hypothetical protein